MYLSPNNIINSSNIAKKIIQTRTNAYIIALNCTSARFNFTKRNIERVFPNFFDIHCITPIRLTDPRIDRSLDLYERKLASNLITFVTLWSYELQKDSTGSELDWSFIFEDDVNFIDPSNFSLPNYINPLQELMYNPEIQLKHGVFYLGICGPTFENNSQPLLASFSNNSLLSQKGCGNCAHAMGLTKKRARHFWTDISLYCPIPNGATDIYIHRYCAKNDKYYIFGSNIEWPQNTQHYGIAFQDRERYRSQIW